MNRLKAIRCSILGLALAICALTAVRGETQVLTLIPTEVLSSEDGTTISATRSNKPERLVALNFKSNSMPPEARITGVTLVMYLEAELTGYQDIDVFIVSKGGPLAKTDVDKIFLALKTEKWPPADNLKKTHNLQLLSSASLETSQAGLAAEWRASTQDGTFTGLNPGFTLILGSGSFRSSRWYGLLPLDSKLQPRLIIDYTTGDEPALAQPAAVQSGRSFIPHEKPNPQTSYRAQVMQTSAAWSYAPAFHGGFVYLMTDEKPKKVLSWHRPLGAIAGSIPLLTEPGQHLLVSESGHLYIIGTNKILPYRIGTDGKPELRTVTPEGRPTTSVNVSGLNPDARHAPTLGADGSMFYVSRMNVVGRNPDLQELWKVSLGDSNASRVTIGPSGQYVYLTTQEEGLVTIDARTGETVKNPLPNQKKLKNSDSPTLHAPVVIRHTDGTEKVYVAANSGDSGVLALFANEKTRAGTDDDARIEAAEGWAPLKGLVGQLLVSDFDPKRIYVVRVKEGVAELVSLDWLTGALPEQRSPTFIVGKDGPYLLNGGNLATDKDGNIFLWNGDTETHLRGFTPALKLLFKEKLSGVQSKANLWFGTDGSLYAGAVGAKADLRAVVPHYTLDTDTQGTNIYSPTHLSVDGKAGQGEKLVLKAGGSVLFGKGFSVKKGTTLKVKVGVLYKEK